MHRRLPAISACFALSGAASLTYQVAWVDRFASLLGSTSAAMVAVLSAFMAGLALGAALAGRASSRVGRPLRLFAFIELGIAGVALLVPSATEAVAVAHNQVVARLGSTGGLLTSSFAASFLVLIVPTGLMGASLPVLVRHVVRARDDIGPGVGMLHAFNTVGAAAGALLAAFALLPRVGLDRTESVAALANLAIALIAFGLDRASAPVHVEGGVLDEVTIGRWHRMAPLVFVGGAAMFAYEVLWTRLLAHLLGGSIYSFATMVATILIGLAIGSAVAGRLATDERRARLGFIVSQVGTGVVAIAAFLAADRLTGLMAPLSAGWDARLFRGWWLASSTMLPGAIFAGAGFPFAVRVVANDPKWAAVASARVYAWGTVGSILGCLGVGLLLLPRLGFWGTVVLAAGSNLVVAASAALIAPPRYRSLSAAIVIAVVALVLSPAQTPWNLLRHRPMASTPAPGEVRHLGVGRHATVLLTEEAHSWSLGADGLPESRIAPYGAPIDLQPARWLTLLPSALRDAIRSMLVVGLGGGVMLEEMPLGLGEVDVVELEPEIVEANHHIVDERRVDPLADPRVAIRIDDARRYLRLHPGSYDAIASQPSHPWTQGASQLFTREFFDLVSRRLGDGGVFVQWIGLRFIDETLLRSIVATLLEVFEFVEIYQPPPGGALFLVASQRPLPLERTVATAIKRDEQLWQRMGVSVPEDILITRRVDASGAKAVARGGEAITDGRNQLRFRSPRLGSESLGKEGARRLLAHHDPLPGIANEFDVAYLVRVLLRNGEPGRARIVAQQSSDAATRRAAQGVIRIFDGDRRLGARALEEALQIAPGSVEALHNLVLLHRGAPRGGTSAAFDLQGLGGPAEQFLQALEAAAAADWERLRRFEPALKSIGPRDPLYREATRLRALWRLHSGEAEWASEALSLVEALSAGDPRQALFILRAECAVAAGDRETAIQSLLAVTGQQSPVSRGDRAARRVRRVFDQLGEAQQVRGYDELRRRLAVSPAAEIRAGGQKASVEADDPIED